MAKARPADFRYARPEVDTFTELGGANPRDNLDQVLSGTPFTLRIATEMVGSSSMELAIQIQVEELPEGAFLATSDQLPGLVAQGRTVSEALEIARDVARKLIDARREREGIPNLPMASERRDYTIVVAA